jgi:hypothetical protein
MANLLPADKAAEQLERAVHNYLATVQTMKRIAQQGSEGLKAAELRHYQKVWKQAYSEVSAAQWELETILGVN